MLTYEIQTAEKTGTAVPVWLHRPAPDTWRTPAHAGSRRDPESIVRAVECSKTGDPEAFGFLYEVFSVPVYAYVVRRIRNSVVAEDIASETFLRAFRRIETFTWQGSDFVAWLITIARNLVFDYAKSSARSREVLTDSFWDSHFVHHHESAEEIALTTLSADAVKRAMVYLADDQRTCLALRMLVGYSVAETAEQMGRTHGAVKSLQYRATKALLAILGDMQETCADESVA